ncbi:MAG: hypothetical protein M3355_10650 [Actinomycetota bacterium]|nr:hypothetical protein [Actinomycetota bacterium]
MLAVHVTVGVAVLATNLAAGLWGGYAWYRQAPTEGFWYLLRVAQVAVVLQALVGSFLLLTGRESAEGLHYLYGVLPVMVSMLAEAARAGAGARELEGIDFDALPRERQRLVALAIFRRETGIMAVSALVVFGLALRAAGTSAGLL